MNIAIVGATGIVGRKIIDVLEERSFFADNFYLFSSRKSQGKVIKMFGENLKTEYLSENVLQKRKIDLAFFAVNNEISSSFVPLFVKKGCTVIDNSSTFRLLDDVPLVVPSVNAKTVFKHRGIIANPNCSTIMLMPILNALKSFGLKRVTVSTYQAVSGAGQKAIDDFHGDEKGLSRQVFKQSIYSDYIPKIGEFCENGYTEEELKIINESRKILDLSDLNISATAVRVPVINCHAESVNIQLDEKFDLKEISSTLKNAKDITLFEGENFPTACDADNTDRVLVGRLRRDFSCENALWLWAVSDNLRVGAATNAVKIAEILLNSTFFGTYAR